MSTKNLLTANPGWQRIGRILGLDRAIVYSVLARGWSSCAGVITVTLIAHFLSRVEQGYYYTFGSLVALQIVFELGFSFVILQMASHESAHLKIGDDGTITGDKIAHARLASVLQKSVRWYSGAALLMLGTLIPAGLYFFSRHSEPGTQVSWRLPWLLVAVAATFTFQIDPLFSFLEGCGYVPQVAHTRLRQAIAGSLMSWTALLLHHGLFSPAMMILGQAIAGSWWLFQKRRILLGLLKYPADAHRVHWGEEVWTFQWRIAVSWLCGYFIFQLFNPLLFVFRGPVAAGQMGMSLSLATALQSVAIAWISTKAAPFGTMIARKEYSKLDHLFFRSLWQSVGVCSIGALLVWLGAVGLNLTHLRFAQRLLSPTLLALLLFTTIINIVIAAQALYLRAHKQEKFLLNSVLGAVLVACSAYFLGKHFGAAGMVVGNLFIGILMGLPFATYVFVKYRRVWHAE